MGRTTTRMGWVRGSWAVRAENDDGVRDSTRSLTQPGVSCHSCEVEDVVDPVEHTSRPGSNPGKGGIVSSISRLFLPSRSFSLLIFLQKRKE
jgi:hypothetical protein